MTVTVPDAFAAWEADALLCNLALTAGRPLDEDDMARLGDALILRTVYDIAHGGKGWGGPPDVYLPAALSLFADPDRLGAFGDLKEGDALPDATYWRLLRDAWSATHDTTLPLARTLWHRYFTSTRPEREHLMSPAERAALAALPDRVTVHRGFCSGDPSGWRGLSWTLDAEIANRFALLRSDEYPGEPRVSSATIPRGRIVALLNHRREQEVIVPFPAGAQGGAP